MVQLTKIILKQTARHTVVRFLMVSIPWFTSVFQAGKDIPTLLQFIKGRVKPSRGTEQS